MTAEELLGALLRLNPDAAVVVDLHGTVLGVNEQAVTLFGRPESDLVGGPVETLLPERLRASHEADRSGYVLAPTLRPMGVGLELWGRRADGTEFPVDVSLAPLDVEGRTLVVATIRDITERQLAGTAQARLAAIVESSDDAIVAITPEGVVTDWNPGAERMLGWSAEEIIGGPVTKLVPPELVHEILEVTGRVAEEGSAVTFDTRRLHKDGHAVEVSITVSPLRDRRSRLLGFTGAMRDVTGRRRAETELQRLVGELQHANDELQAANQLKSDLVAIASHEFRTPLTTILGFARTLLQRWDAFDDATRRHFIETIAQQGDRLARLTDDMLTMSRIEADALEPEVEELDVREVVAEAIAELGDAANGVGVECPTGLAVVADRHYLRQILHNYVANALKYGVPPVRITATHDDSSVVLRVTDEGEGVPALLAPRLFERFVRGRDERSRVSGTGLGLSIVLGLARAHGGDAWYEPNRPRGSCFAVRLPAPT